MRYRTSGSTITTKVMCAIAFLAFVFCFTYYYQANTLMYLQHVLSDGKTSYDPLIGSCVLCVVAFALQFVTSRFFRFADASHALSYLPSMFLLLLLTDVHPIDAPSDMLGGVETGTFYWFVPIVLLVYAVVVRFAKQWIPLYQKGGGVLSSTPLLLSLLTMVVMMGGVSVLANGDRVFLARVDAERSIKENDMDGVIRATEKPLRPDTTLTTFRTLAMLKKGTVGDSLFCSEVTGSVASLMEWENVHISIIRKIEIQRLMPKKKTYRELEYKLCGLLLERNIDDFARLLSRHYKINDSLPHHYKEAIVLYQHLRSNPLTNYDNKVMEVDYQGVQEINHSKLSYNEKREQIRKYYRNTYWAYYFIKK